MDCYKCVLKSCQDSWMEGLCLSPTHLLMELQLVANKTSYVLLDQSLF